MTRPISDYALIGDTRTGALVASDGSIDWWCVPRFDGQPICARLVGGEDAGHLSLSLLGTVTLLARDYLPGTPVVQATWRTETGQAVCTDGMVSTVSGSLRPSSLLVRRVEARGGPCRVRVTLQPRYGPGQSAPRVRRSRGGVIASWSDLALAVSSEPALALRADGSAEVVVRPGSPLTVAFGVAHRQPAVHVPPDLAWQDLMQDAARWARWSDAVPADVPFRDAARRSAMVLRLLTYSPSGAPVAAPTTSLPEEIGGIRNWDYRFTWPRDASIGAAAFTALGYEHEAKMFLRWLLHASRLERPRLPAILTLDGRPAPPEKDLAGWPGYRDSTPVRVGNGAHDQHQLDGYGWVVDAAWTHASAGYALPNELRRAAGSFADFVASRWRDPDSGIWEERAEPRHHTHSKLMAWLALDRAVRLAATPRGPTLRGARQSARVRTWAAQRDQVAAELKARGFNPGLGAYTRSYGAEDFDAAMLLLPVTGLEPADSARVTGTIDAIRTRLSAGGPFLYRYRPGSDGLPGGEGAFLPCSFWLVQALARTGRVEQARETMAALLNVAPMGLFSEEIDPTSKELLGNYPQALTHAALLQAVLALRDAEQVPRRGATGRRG